MIQMFDIGVQNEVERPQGLLLEQHMLLILTEILLTVNIVLHSDMAMVT